MLVQLVVQPLRAAHLALLLCDLGLHLCTLNVPGIPSALVIVPFELQEAHYSCSVVSLAALPGIVCLVSPAGAVPCSVYSVPAGALPSAPPFAPPAFMADGDCHAMAVLRCCVMPVWWTGGGDGACDVGGRPTSAVQLSKLQNGPQKLGWFLGIVVQARGRVGKCRTRYDDLQARPRLLHGHVESVHIQGDLWPVPRAATSPSR